MIEVQIEGLQEARDKMARLTNPELVDKTLDRAIVEGLTDLTSKTQFDAPANSGTYRRTIQWGRKAQHSFWFGSPSPLSIWLEYGTLAHEIYPKYKKALRWKEALGLGAQLAGVRGRVGSQKKIGFAGQLAGISGIQWVSKSSKDFNDVFARHVNHPGTRPQPHLVPNVQGFKAEMPKKIADALLELV